MRDLNGLDLGVESGTPKNGWPTYYLLLIIDHKLDDSGVRLWLEKPPFVWWVDRANLPAGHLVGELFGCDLPAVPYDGYHGTRRGLVPKNGWKIEKPWCLPTTWMISFSGERNHGYKPLMNGITH